MLILPSMYQSTIFGTSVRPRAPPKAVPFQTRPVTSWKGRVEISCPAAATPMMIDFAPAAMAAFERLAHRRRQADALEGEIGAPAGQVDDRLDHLVAADLVGVDVVGHAELVGHLGLGRIEVDADDLVGARHPGALDDVETDATEPEHRDIGAGPDLRGVDHGADAGGDAAADIADLVEGRVLAHLGERDLRQHGEIGEGRAAHVVEDLAAVAGEAAVPSGMTPLPCVARIAVHRLERRDRQVLHCRHSGV